jgi:8-oxo-dGTP pyrophosphatase MutT (NUDIX family)
MNDDALRADWKEHLAQSLLVTPCAHAHDFRVSGLSRAESASLLHLVPPELVRAAALIAIVERVSEPTLLLTVRSAGLRLHGGEVSFAGGKVEKTDATVCAAALREATEEIGLRPAATRLLGYLPDHLLIQSGFAVTPVVVTVVADTAFDTNPSEVAETFELPLRHVLDRQNWKRRIRRLREHEFPVFDIVVGDRAIVGATAGMIVTLQRFIRQTSPE